MSNTAMTYGTAKSLAANQFSRTGYKFKGWSTSANGGVVYTNGQSVSNLTTQHNVIVNLYAVWEPITYSVKYNALPVLRCEGCGLCKRACPTGILSESSCDCLSAITQKKGDLSEKEIEMMLKFNTVWGCDECQSACPHNRNPRLTPIEFFKNDRITELTLDAVNSMSDEEFSKRAFAWRGRKTVIRNLEHYEKKSYM